MSVPQRWRTRIERALFAPKTVELQPLQALLPEVAAQGVRLARRTDSELTAEARALRGSCHERLSQADMVTACSLAREAAHRGLGERPFDVQILGALAMLSGHVAEMATGEGKTLAAAVAAFGHVLRGEPVHVLTVNDYLARRDAEWMAPVYERLGVSVGWVAEVATPAQRRAAYACDITYASIGEVGYDFLRDGLRDRDADRVQRGLATVIVDEADSILVDEARVPLILAGARDFDSSLTATVARVARTLERGHHYEVADAGRVVELTEAGITAAETAFGGVNLYGPEHLEWLTALNLALHAEVLLRRDVEYIVRDGRVDLVDEYRGRTTRQRRWPDGLQAAVEAKENLLRTTEGEVLATVTVQAFIGLYRTRCGMTATAMAVRDQLREFYDLAVTVVPPNVPSIRIDALERVYLTRHQREAALVAEVAAAHAVCRPVLIGTLDVARSERVAALLRAADIECVVLNAKDDAAEAAIVARAGAPGAVTVSTQMAGRGTDIRLGGPDEARRAEVVAVGGLYVIGCGRHDSRRVDDQLRGRAARQGDPGGSLFLVSLDDDLITRYGAAALPSPTSEARKLRRAIHSGPGGMVDDATVAAAVEHAQTVAEGITYEVHRNTWRYNLFIELQRRVVAQRREDLLRTPAAATLLADRDPGRSAEVLTRVGDLTGAARSIALYHLDERWTEHLAYLADVREGIGLRVLAHRDPVDEFHRECAAVFRTLLAEIDDATVDTFAATAASITSPEWTVADAGYMRPTATWTYMVNENPLSDGVGFGVGFARKYLRKAV
jgi:preprotein translocase subunit SecA